MIAHIRETPRQPRSRVMRRAHRLVATTLLKKRLHPADGAAPVPAWRSWLFTLWVVVVTGVYMVYMAT